MSEAFDAVLSFLNAEELRHLKVEDEQMAIVQFRSDDGPIRCHVKVYEERELAMVEAFAPFAAPKRRRRELCKFACMVNSNLIISCFSFDPDDGEILVRTSSCYKDYTVDAELFRRLLDLAMSILTDHLPALRAVVFDGKSAVGALAEEDEDQADASPAGELPQAQRPADQPSESDENPA